MPVVFLLTESDSFREVFSPFHLGRNSERDSLRGVSLFSRLFLGLLLESGSHGPFGRLTAHAVAQAALTVLLEACESGGGAGLGGEREGKGASVSL